MVGPFLAIRRCDRDVKVPGAMAISSRSEPTAKLAHVAVVNFLAL